VEWNKLTGNGTVADDTAHTRVHVKAHERFVVVEHRALRPARQREP
jgi:hypothetical protein